MPKRGSIVLFCIAIGLLVIWLLARTQRSEVLVEGESIDVWVRQLASETWREDAKHALTAAGLPALPDLARAFEQRDSLSHRAQSRLYTLNDQTATVVKAPFPWEKVRSDLAEIMGAIGKSYRFGAHEQRSAPPRELQIAVDALSRGLQDTNAIMREWCAQQLAGIGPNAQSAIPVLLRALQAGQIRDVMVFQAFGTIGPGAFTNEVVHALGKGLRASSRAVQLAAVEALSGMTGEAAAAVPALVDLLNNSDAGLGDAALRTLARIGHLPAELNPRLERLLNTSDVFGRAAAAVALLRIDATHARAVAVVKECIQTNKITALRSSTVYLIGGMGSEATVFQSELNQLQYDPDPNVATFARDALKACRVGAVRK
jgi:hypothetical protein